MAAYQGPGMQDRGERKKRWTTTKVRYKADMARAEIRMLGRDEKVTKDDPSVEIGWLEASIKGDMAYMGRRSGCEVARRGRWWPQWFSVRSYFKDFAFRNEIFFNNTTLKGKDGLYCINADKKLWKAHLRRQHYICVIALTSQSGVYPPEVS